MGAAAPAATLDMDVQQEDTSGFAGENDADAASTNACTAEQFISKMESEYRNSNYRYNNNNTILKEQEQDSPVLSAVCTCDCVCEQCFCGFDYCQTCRVESLMSSVEPVELDEASMSVLSVAVERFSVCQYYESLPMEVDQEAPEDPGLVLKEPEMAKKVLAYRQLIFDLHIESGHQMNFRNVVRDFQCGYYDSEVTVVEAIRADVQELRLFKRISHRVGYKQFSCSDCQMAKIKATRREKQTEKEDHKAPFEEGYVDIVGPIWYGYGGYGFIMFYICASSWFIKAAPTRERDIDGEVKPIVQQWRLSVRDSKWEMQKLHFDSDGIFKKKDFIDFLNAADISAHFAPPGQHWVNGFVEVFIGIIENNAVAMLRASGLPFKYWVFAFQLACWLHNIIYRRRRKLKLKDGEYFRSAEYEGLTPFEIVYDQVWTRKKLIFGQAVVCRHSDLNKLTKLVDRGRMCVFLGIDMDSHFSNILLHLKTDKVINSRDAIAIGNVYGWTMKPI